LSFSYSSKTSIITSHHQHWACLRPSTEHYCITCRLRRCRSSASSRRACCTLPQKLSPHHPIQTTYSDRRAYHRPHQSRFPPPRAEPTFLPRVLDSQRTCLVESGAIRPRQPVKVPLSTTRFRLGRSAPHRVRKERIRASSLPARLQNTLKSTRAYTYYYSHGTPYTAFE
jgi:hypothetical protein